METHFENLGASHASLARERVVADLKLLVRDSEDLLKATAGDVSEKAREARARMTAALERARGTVDELSDQTLEQAKAAAKQADSLVRAHPYEAMGIAFGVGLLLGVVFSRK
jgi:ElaB/YqjD/DUF883 family membrane-anchored ribosome-binding protein